jgi:two-component system CheB/CheR fusion protein
VLVVEDNRDMSAFLTETLSRDYRVVTAFDGQEGLSRAVELVPDLILSDVMMPRMCGEQMVRELRKHRELDSVPIVLLTARSDQQSRLSLLKAGAISYLHKPFSAEELLVRVGRLIADRQSNVKSVRRAYALLRAVTEGITDSVFVKDLNGRYLMINSAGAAAVGRSVEQVLGRDDHELFSPETARRITDEDRQVIEEGRTKTFENINSGPDGDRIYLATRTPYRDQERRIIGVMGIARDITERKRVEQELREAKEAAEAANRAKDQFLAMLSHELRTPLTPVLATVTCLEARSDLSPDLRRDITMIRRNVEMEARLIDDLLDLTRVSRGKIELHYEALDAHASLRRALDICQRDIESNRLELSLCLWAESHHIWADPARMQQVFWNLINNAVKFTGKGGRITLRTFNDEHGRLVVQVSDTGVGISPELLPQIFNAFEQGEATRQRQFGGLGLGLAISKALVDRHGAELFAESDGPDRGATFTLRIDSVEVAPAAADPPADFARDAGGAKNLRILLVEDHKDTRMMMASLLRLLGHQVETATCVREALERGDSQEFDLLISDIGLPDGSGLEIMRTLHREQGLRGIALSGYGMEEDIRQSKSAGFEEHLTKPIDLRTLERAIQELALDSADASAGA